MNRKRLRTPSVVSGALTCGVLLLASCSTYFKENYHVGVYQLATTADGKQAKPTQFYRFRLKGWSSLFSKTRYEAGWYDASVVDRLFGEIRPTTSVPTGELPAASKAPIDIIPLLFATGDVPSGGTSVVGHNVNVKLRGKKADIPLTNVNQVHADALTVRFEYAEDEEAEDEKAKDEKAKDESVKKEKPVLVTLQVAGNVDVTFTVDADLTQFTDNPSIEVTAMATNSSLVCENLSALDLAGGIIDITSISPQSRGETWMGTNEHAFTRSPYHHFDWTGGKFTILNGTVQSSFHGLEATGSMVGFKSTSDSPITVRTYSGWLLNVSSSPNTEPKAKLKLKNMSVRTKLVTTNEKKVNVRSNDEQELPSDDLRLENNDNKKKLTKAIKEFREAGQRKPLTLTDVTFELASKKMTLVDDKSETVSVEIDKYRAEKLSVESGAFQLSTTRAVERAIEDGKSVAYQDPQRQIFMHFGPEGVGSTQRKDERFVIFMSANPRVLVNRIRALINSERTQNVVATALIAPRLIKEKKQIQEAQLDTTQAKKFAEEAKKTVDADEFKKATPPEMKGMITSWLGQLGAGPLGVLSIIQDSTEKENKPAVTDENGEQGAKS